MSYARFSTDRQESTEEQQYINAELAAEAGIKVVERFTDDAESRTVRNRSAFMKMLAYLSDHSEVGRVVVGVSDRLTAAFSRQRTGRPLPKSTTLD
ncbi:MAG: recombinase family protein [Mycobacteriales bacterium]